MRCSRKIIFLLAGIFLIFAVPLKGASEKIPLELKANFLEFDSEKKTITARGSVKIKLKKWQILAGRAVIDTLKKEILLEENILIKSKKFRFQSKKAVFDLDKAEITFEKFRTVYFDPSLRGKIFIKASTLDLKENEEFFGDLGKITTCDLKTPHYHLDAKEFEYYPEDKIIVRNLVLWVAGQKVLSRPYQVINLKKDKKQTLFPLIGQNQVEGGFVKNIFDYYFNSQNSGYFYLNFFQKKGLGAGLEHFYDWDKNELSFYLYNLGERDTHLADWIGRFNLNYLLAPGWQFDFEHNYRNTYLIPKGRRRDQDTRFVFSGKEDNYKFSLKIEDRKNFFESPFQNLSTIFDFSQKLSRGLTSNLLLDYRKNQQGALPADLELEIKNLGLSYDFDWGDAELSLKKRFDLDLDSFQGDENFPFFEKLPELKFNLKPQNIGLFNLSGIFGLGRYQEYSRPRYLRSFGFTRAYRGFLGFDVFQDFPVLKNSSISLRTGYAQYMYSTGDARFGVTQQVRWENKINSVLKHTFSHVHNYYLGGNPFSLVDRFSDTNNLRSTLILRDSQENWYFDIGGGYNFLSRYYDDILTKLEFFLNSTWQTSLATGFNLNRNVYKDLIWKNRLKFWDDNLAIDAGMRYDLNGGLITAGEFLFDWTWGSSWENRFRFLVDYVFQRRDRTFQLRGLKIIKDLHCFELAFVYQAIEQQFLINLSIKAFPFEVADMGAGREGLFLKEKTNE